MSLNKMNRNNGAETTLPVQKQKRHAHPMLLQRELDYLRIIFNINLWEIFRKQQIRRRLLDTFEALLKNLQKARLCTLQVFSNVATFHIIFSVISRNDNEFYYSVLFKTQKALEHGSAYNIYLVHICKKIFINILIRIQIPCIIGKGKVQKFSIAFLDALFLITWWFHVI